MAGAGYKLFNTGDVLTAAQVNTYLNEQTVMVFANSTARTTALSGVLAEGMMSYLQDTNSVEVYNGTSWVNVGNAGDITEVQAGVGISIASGTGPIPVITNSSTDLITTAGDLLYGTAADTMARLGIGTAGQVLKVNSGATAPEWGAAGGAAALTKIASGSFSGQASVSVDSVFSSTYLNYVVFMKTTAVTGTDDLQIQLRYAGPTTQTSDYYGAGLSYNSSNTLSNFGFVNAGQATISQDVGTTGGGSAYQLNFSYVGNSSENPVFWGTGIAAGGQKSTQFTCLNDVQRTYTGFLIKSSSSNISGFYAVYGLEN